MTDTDKVRAFADHLLGDGYSAEHVRMIRDLADEVDRLRSAAIHDQFVRDVTRATP